MVVVVVIESMQDSSVSPALKCEATMNDSLSYMQAMLHHSDVLFCLQMVRHLQ